MNDLLLPGIAPCEEHGDHDLVLMTSDSGEPYWKCTLCGHCEQDDGPDVPPGSVI